MSDQKVPQKHFDTIVFENKCLDNTSAPLFMLNRPTRFAAGQIQDRSIENRPSRSWRIVPERGKGSKTFAWKDYGNSKDKAFEAANAYLLHISDELGKTVTLHNSFIHEVPRDLQEYTAGFVDGDGSMGVYLRGDSGTYRVTVGISQYSPSMINAPKVLKLFQLLYGGILLPSPRKHDDELKADWSLKYHSFNSEVILRAVYSYGILKRDQASLLIPVVSQLTPGKVYEVVNLFIQERCAILCPQLKAMKELEEYQDVPIDETRLTIPYIAGVYDAEGSIGIYDSHPTATITQLQSPKLLYAIQHKLGMGAVYGKSFTLRRMDDIIRFFKMILPYSIGKKPQIEEFLTLESKAFCYTNGRGVKRSADEQDLVDETALNLKKMKSNIIVD